MGYNIISLETPILPVNEDSLRDLFYLCVWIEATLSQTYEIRRSVMLNLVIVNVGNSSRTEISIVVLTHIAWVTITTFVCTGFLRPPIQNVAFAVPRLNR